MDKVKDNNRGKWENPFNKAVKEQEQAEQIMRAVESAEHYNYLKKKFGPRTSDPGVFNKNPSITGKEPIPVIYEVNETEERNHEDPQ